MNSTPASQARAYSRARHSISTIHSSIRRSAHGAFNCRQALPVTKRARRLQRPALASARRSRRSGTPATPLGAPYSPSCRSGPAWGLSTLRSSPTARPTRGIRCRLSPQSAFRSGVLMGRRKIEPMLELDDIQSGLLRPRPAPYAAAYVVFRIDERQAGKELMRRIQPLVASVARPESPAGETWVSVALSFQGLRALGVPQASLDSFSPEFQQGMAARSAVLGDTGESSPEHWEKPLGSADVHIVL